ncbi:MAG: alpha/beta fold hydrolase [Anaerolineae bacterium]|nr:alpha/beta fold hydrolase [Anaerolineae bacterium]
MKPSIRQAPHYLFILASLLLVVPFCSADLSPVQAQSDLTADRAGFEPVECPMKVPGAYTVECGMVMVPEDHVNPGGPTIMLPVAIVHSTGSSPAPDPLLFIDGGPGGRTLDSMSFWLETINPLLAKRDIIFFDQRGTGYSQPALTCMEMDRATTLEEAYDLDRSLECRDRLLDEGINLSAYNSIQNAADIAALREALGIETWNLYGVSYGSRVALTVLRDHPQGVRSVILDALTPVENDLLLEDAANADAALRAVFRACRADSVCRAMYPDLEPVYTEVVGDLAAHPVDLTITHPRTGETKIERLDGAAFNGFVIDSLAMPETSGAPGLIYEARAGNYDPVIASLESAWEHLEENQKMRASVGLQLAVLCGEEAPFMPPEAFAAMLDAYPPEANLMARSAGMLYSICQSWGIGPAEPVRNAPVVSDLPVLILAGQYDAARTPAEVRQAAEPLSNSTVIEFPGAGHSVVLSGSCPLSIIARFLDDPTTGPDATCTADMPTPRFYPTISRVCPAARALAALIGVVGLASLLYAGAGLTALAIRRRGTWRTSLRRAGWSLPAISVLASLVLYWLMPVIDLTYFYERSLMQAVVIVVPIVSAIHTAILVSPADEPGLEILLACPRPLHWLYVERVVTVIAGQAAVALATTAFAVWILGEQHTPAALIGWLASALFLSGLAAFISVRSRRASMAALIAILAWLVFGVGAIGAALLPASPLGANPPWPRPLHLVQPLIWIGQPFLRPDALTGADFVLNRVVVGGLGIGLHALAMMRLSNAERLILSRASRHRTQSRKAPRLIDRLANAPGSARLAAMVHYEMLMGWRCGALRAVLFVTLTLPQLMYLLGAVFGPITDSETSARFVMWPEAARMVGTNAAIFANIPTLILAILFLPFMVAEIVPLDRQYQVRELVDSLPVTSSTYLAGKLLSVWPGIAIMMVLAALLSGVLTQAQNGPIDSGTLVAFWLTGPIPLALFSTQMGVLLAAGQPNRRRAIPVALAAVIFNVAALFILPVTDFLMTAVLRMAFALEELADPYIQAALPDFPAAFSLNTLLRVAALIAVMAVVWAISVRSMRREDRRHRSPANNQEHSR